MNHVIDLQIKHYLLYETQELNLLCSTVRNEQNNQRQHNTIKYK